ncbi:MAG: trypsin-like peptidase domain-containing protein [Anaerolineae bacterium]|nr:trypsin-like peptidase domain-containing protein [Anaerolineae bacterium]
MNTLKWRLVIILAALLIFSLSLGTISGLFTAAQVEARPEMQQTVSSLTQIYNQVSPSVVAINVTAQSGRGISSGTGSGFVIDTQGHIITNNHVVSGAEFIEVEFYSGTLAEAEIVGLDPDSDLALLVVNDLSAEPLIPITFGDSDALLVGDNVLAIGSPYGQDWTLTTGIVSGLNRVISGLNQFSIGGVIQTDAAINPGNSGGPLLNMNGQVVGVNSQILSESGSNSGVGFAIPGNLVQRVAQELMTDGTVDYSYIGISGGDVTLALLQSLNLPNTTRGVVVNEVVSGAPAAQAGLQNATNRSFDIITAIDGTPVKGMDELISYLARETVPNQNVTLTVLRNGSQTLSVPVTLASRP